MAVFEVGGDGLAVECGGLQRAVAVIDGEVAGGLTFEVEGLCAGYFRSVLLEREGQLVMDV